MTPSLASRQDAETEDTTVNRRSRETFETAKSVFPDGTTRITVERDPYPRYVTRGEGAYVWDLDGNRFLDLNNNFTTLIHGHAFAPVTTAVQRRLADGSCFANPTESEIELAGLLCSRVPALEQIRFVNTGTEAVMFAIKAARAHTGRTMIAKIEGAYHGSYDWAEVSQYTHPGIWGNPDHPNTTAFYDGVPKAVLDDVLILRFNDAAGARQRLAQYADRIACVLLDPMPSRAGLIAPEPAFVDALNEACKAHGIVLISDEVLNFRQSYHGAAHRYGISPDLFCFGKIIGGGLPIGAVGGSRDVMRVFDATEGRPPLPQGGTFSANPLSMAAGLAAMSVMDRSAFAYLETLGDNLRNALTESIAKQDAPFCITGAASLFRIHPLRPPPRDFRESYVTGTGARVMAALSRFFLSQGILLPKAAAACLSMPMTTDEIASICDVFERFLREQADIVDALAEEQECR